MKINDKFNPKAKLFTMRQFEINTKKYQRCLYFYYFDGKLRKYADIKTFPNGRLDFKIGSRWIKNAKPEERRFYTMIITMIEDLGIKDKELESTTIKYRSYKRQLELIKELSIKHLYKDGLNI